jgi:hypothetical protein
VFALEFEPFGHQLHDDRGAAHRERTAERDRALPAQPPAATQHREDRTQCEIAEQRDQDRQRDLAQAQPEHELTHAAQLGQVEFEADHEHQEHDAELGQVADARGVARQRGRVRADQHANHQVAQHRRQLGHAAHDDTRHRGDEVKQHQTERRRDHRAAEMQAACRGTDGSRATPERQWPGPWANRIGRS